jgi:TolB-like protein/Tfp pilus assembly protein PilF
MTIWSSEIKELEKLYDSIKGKHPKLDNELQRLIKTDDENIVLVYARRCLEVVITDLSERELKRPRGTEPLKGIIDRLNKEEKIPYNITVSMQNLNSLSAFGAHPKDFDPRQVKPVLLDLTTSLDWYIKYLEAQSTAVTEPGVPGKIRKEPAGVKKVAIGSKKRILLVSSILLVLAVIYVTLILTDVIKSGKSLKAAEIKSLIVLPFSNYSGQDTLDWFVSGMHSSLVQDISKIGSLRIPGTTTSQVFKNSNKTIKEITSELKVDAALETAVLCLGKDSICFQIRLIKSGQEEEQLWIADYKIARNQILNWYNGVTKEIAKEIKIELTDRENKLLARSITIDMGAYNDYLKGLYYLEDVDKESLMKAMGYLNRAVEKSPDWAPLYNGLTMVWASMAQMGFESPEIAGPKIFENLNKTLELDPDNSDSRFLSGEMAFLAEWDWEKSEKELLKALAINPSNAIARVIYAQLLSSLQRPGEALMQANMAIDLDPNNPMLQLQYAGALLCVGDCQNALIQAEKVTADEPGHYLANNIILCAAISCREYNKVIKADKYLLHVFNYKEDDIKEFERIFNEQGLIKAYEKVMIHLERFAENNPISPIDIAIRYMMVNQPNKAMEWIEKGFESHDPGMVYITTAFYSFDPLLSNPKFIDIIKKMNLPLPKN